MSTDKLLNQLNQLKGLVYPQIGYSYFADITGGGRKSVYTISNQDGGVIYSVLNARNPRKRCQYIRDAIQTLTGMKTMVEWKDKIDLSGKHAIVLTRKLLANDQFEYELLQLFRFNETSKWSIDCQLSNFAADNFNPNNYNGLVLVEQR
jgi:hypothetical protein